MGNHLTSFRKIFSSRSERKLMRKPVALSAISLFAESRAGFRIALRASGKTLSVLLVLASLLLSSSAYAVTASPSEVVKNFYAQLTTVMKQGDKLDFAGRYKKLEPVVQQTFNLPLMTRFAVGLVWSDASPAEQKQITSAFSDFSVATYASRFAAYDGEQFSVGAEKPTNGGTLVETTLKSKDGDAVALNYLLKQDDKGAWRIVDVFLNGAISELATRRAEFSSVIKRDGFGALVNTLDVKSKSMGQT